MSELSGLDALEADQDVGVDARQRGAAAEQGQERRFRRHTLDVPHGGEALQELIELRRVAQAPDVEAALGLLLDEKQAITADAVKALVKASTSVEVPAIPSPVVDLRGYDLLLAGACA